MKNRKITSLRHNYFDKYNKKVIRYKYVSNNFSLFFKFYFMREYKKIELEILNIQIGCVLRYARLFSKLSQQDLGSSLGYTSVMIGRVERFENISGWDKIYYIAEKLEVNFHELFILKTKDELLKIIEESLKLEVKLNQEKRDYYEFLKKTVVKNYDLLSKFKKDS